MNRPTTVTAAVLVIGDEILSGRTKDRNLGYIAEYLAQIGVDVREARVVPDVEDEIVAALNALRARYDYVITTGGIGPTHDDITADAVARAFGVTIGEDPRVIAAHAAALSAGRPDARAAAHGAHSGGGRAHRQSGLEGAGISHRQRVSCIAGVPSRHAGDARFRREVDEDRRGDAGRNGRGGRHSRGPLRRRAGAIAAAHPNSVDRLLSVFKDGRFNNQIVVRGKDDEARRGGAAAVEEMLAALFGHAAAR